MCLELKQRLDADSVHPRKSNRDHARGTTSFSDSKRLMTDPRSKSPQPYRAISGDKYSVPNIFTRKYMKYVQKQSGRDEPNGKEPWRHDKLPGSGALCVVINVLFCRLPAAFIY